MARSSRECFSSASSALNPARAGINRFETDAVQLERVALGLGEEARQPGLGLLGKPFGGSREA